MDLSNLRPAKNSIRKSKVRLGKGQGSGKGGTSTKGHKGAKARAGYKRKKGYEGGQMPLQRRIPKYGFTSINKKEYKGINISTLQTIADKKNLTSIDVQTLIDEGFASKKDLIKILGNGKLTSKLEVKAHAFSKSARQAIESLNGTAVKI
jgi:large subunit ribosomal protein L15